MRHETILWCFLFEPTINFDERVFRCCNDANSYAPCHFRRWLRTQKTINFHATASQFDSVSIFNFHFRPKKKTATNFNNKTNQFNDSETYENQFPRRFRNIFNSSSNILFSYKTILQTPFFIM